MGIEPTIFLDVDGVLANFAGEVCKLFSADERIVFNKCNGVYDLSEALEVSSGIMWAAIDAEGISFWRRIRPFKWAEELWKACLKVGDVYFCTSVPLNPIAAAGRLWWLERYFEKPLRDYVLTSHKELLSREGTILIDDSEENINRFKRCGKGEVILFPQPWNRAGQEVGHGFGDYFDPSRMVIEQLNTFCNSLKERSG